LHTTVESSGKGLIFLSITLVLMLSLPLVASPTAPISYDIVSVPSIHSPAKTSHAPISISNDDEFKALGFEGDGSETAPYLIRDLSINAGIGTGITIVSTSVFFTIRDCEIFSSDDKTGTGIYFEKVSNGRVVNCQMYSVSVGISILKSQKSGFMNNTISHVGKGFYFIQSSAIIIENNTLTKAGYGIHFSKTDYSELNSNILDECNYGILIESCVDVSVDSNKITTSFFGLYFHNTINGKSVRNTISKSQYGIYLAYSQKCNITLSMLSSNKYGISLLETSDSVIQFNLVKFNSDYGMHIKNSRTIQILENTVFYNSGMGLFLTGVTSSAVHENELGYNKGANAADFVGSSAKALVNNWDTNAWSDYKGASIYDIPGDRDSIDHDPRYIIYVDSPSDFDIEAPGNGFINWSAYALRPSYYKVTLNSILVEEGNWNGSNILVSLSNLDPGVYTYKLAVSTKSGILAFDSVVVNAIDSTPPVWVQAPVDQVVECGSPLSYQLSASDYYGIPSWWVNSTEFSITNGLLQNTSKLHFGVTFLEVRAYDPSGNYASHIIRVSVIDSTPPSVDSPDDIILSEGDLGFAIHWELSDCNPATYEIFRDGISVEFNEWTHDMTSVDYYLNDLSAGIYVFSIHLTDIAGNTATDDVQVTVEVPSTTTAPTTSTTTTGPPISTTTTTSTELVEQSLLTFGLIGVGASIGIVVILFVWKRR
ncbi:MAG: nitrous oxide reductase family maturation protein NosD, partial [Promethearchaeota archaeon]